uniref:Uncharacterized protein n=1 Tax=Rhizophora mucronata TaxID=61149 RepID=A0A2P2NSG3_RHIMU
MFPVGIYKDSLSKFSCPPLVRSRRQKLNQACWSFPCESVLAMEGSRYKESGLHGQNSP